MKNLKLYNSNKTFTLPSFWEENGTVQSLLAVTHKFGRRREKENQKTEEIVKNVFQGHKVRKN